MESSLGFERVVFNPLCRSNPNSEFEVSFDYEGTGHDRLRGTIDFQKAMMQENIALKRTHRISFAIFFRNVSPLNVHSLHSE